MNERCNLRRFPVALESFAQPIFNGLYIVVRATLDLLYPRRVLLAEIRQHRLQLALGLLRKWPDFTQAALFGQRQQPADFHFDTAADKRVFTAMRTQCVQLAVVTPVKRGKSGKRGRHAWWGQY